MTGLEAFGWGTALIAGALPSAFELSRQTMSGRKQRQAPGRFAALSQGKTHYDWIGPKSGPVAVCVHGLTTPSFVYLGLARHLVQQGFRVLIYDLYGRGWSDRPRGVQNPDFFCQQLHELLAHEEIESDITLIGYSMGGAIAATFAAQHDHRLRRLILLAPAGMGHNLGRLSHWATEWPFLGDWAFHLGFPRVHRRSSEADRDQPSTVENITDLQLAELKYKGYVRSVLASLRGTLRRPLERTHRELARSQLPITAIWGEADTVIPLSAMGTLAQWNRDVRHHVIEGAGHGLAYSHTAAVAEAIQETWGGPVAHAHPPIENR